jgi:glycosyltransferase A (GT-A) superfamily protein (DUF2064 family)
MTARIEETTRVAAVVPVIDERAAIGGVVLGLRQVGVCCVFVVDAGSRDGTASVAAAAGAIVVDEPRRGYGRACLTGAERALGRTGHGHVHDRIAFLDGDGSCDPDDLPALDAALASSDVALGWRVERLVERSAIAWHARLGNRLVAGLLSLRSGRSVHDLPPFKVLRAQALDRLALDDDGYGWTVQLVARALADPTLRVVERPVAFRVRRGGSSKVSGSPSASFAAARAMLARALEETRPRPLLALMGKAPGAGHAKTRLALDLGDRLAADLWRACLSDGATIVLEAARRSQSTPVVMLPGIEDVAPVTDLVGHALRPLVQQRPGLAAALCDVFLAAFDANADRAIAIAGDAPSLTPARIQHALDVLERGDARAAVIGPTPDGGYHLVGLRWQPSPRWWPPALRGRMRRRLSRRLEAAFEGVPMGRRTALEATERALAVEGWRTTRVAACPDLDTLDDLRMLARTFSVDGHWASATSAWIAGHQDVIAAGRLPSEVATGGRK